MKGFENVIFFFMGKHNFIPVLKGWCVPRSNMERVDGKSTDDGAHKQVAAELLRNNKNSAGHWRKLTPCKKKKLENIMWKRKVVQRSYFDDIWENRIDKVELNIIRSQFLFWTWKFENFKNI